MVQMIAMKDMRIETPSGQSVPFWMDQTCFEGKNFGIAGESGFGTPPVVPVTDAGIMTITMNKPIIFRVEP